MTGSARRREFGEPCALELACRVLLEGQVAVLPTDTLYGLSAVASAERGLRRLRQLKGTPERRGFVALVERLESLDPFLAADQDERALELLRSFWPAALTAVLKVRQALPWAEQLESEWTAAFRVPAHPRLRQLLGRLGSPLVSTSVNRTGQEPLRSLEVIAREFGGEADIWMFADRGLEMRRLESSPASTIVDLTSWPLRVVRRGRIAVEALVAASGGA